MNLIYNLIFCIFAANSIIMKVSGKKIHVQAKDSEVFAKLCNCNNFGKFLPEQIKDWESTADYCKFSIPGVATLMLNIQEKVEFSKVVFAASNDKHIPVNITLNLAGQGDGTDVNAEIEAEVPAFLSGMVQKPLQNLVDMIADKIKNDSEK